MKGPRRKNLHKLVLGRLDVVFMTGEAEIAGHVAERLWTEHVFVVLSSDHKLAEVETLSWQEVRDETFIVSSGGAGPEIQDYLVKRLAGLGFRPTIDVHDVSRESLMHLVAIGYPPRGGHGRRNDHKGLYSGLRRLSPVRDCRACEALWRILVDCLFSTAVYGLGGYSVAGLVAGPARAIAAKLGLPLDLPKGSVGYLVGAACGIILLFAFIRCRRPKLKAPRSENEGAGPQSPGAENDILLSVLDLVKFVRSLLYGLEAPLITILLVAFAVFAGSMRSFGYAFAGPIVAVAGFFVLFLNLAAWSVLVLLSIPALWRSAAMDEYFPKSAILIVTFPVRLATKRLPDWISERTTPTVNSRSAALAIWLVLDLLLAYAAMYAVLIHELKIVTDATIPVWREGARQVFGASYFSVVTFATLGYGDLLPLTPGARIAAMAEVMNGVLLFGVFVAYVSNTIGEVRQVRLKRDRCLRKAPAEKSTLPQPADGAAPTTAADGYINVSAQ